MVECSRLIVNDRQIRVDGYFLDFQIISIGKFRDNKVNIYLIGFRKWNFYGAVFNITNRIPGMNPGNIIAIDDITVMNSDKRIGQNSFKMFECFESSDHFAIIQVNVGRIIVGLKITNVFSIYVPIITVGFDA